jgi:ubiquinone/menaquinone biosynthesis C-methylase UbiE
MNPLHEANRQRWEAASDQWARGADLRGDWKPAFTDPTVVFRQEELALLGDVRGKNVCVLGSGNNEAVFALSGMGARVTSVDISQKQLDHARRRAAELKATIAFVCSDVTELKALGDASFDIVYTGGHVAVWVSDLKKYYAEASRILRPGGSFVISEYHPFRRLWKDGTPKLEMATGYYERGPHVYDYSSDILKPGPGDYRSYEFHWTISDYVTAAMAPGNELLSLQEIGDAHEGWEQIPSAGLPQILLIALRKRG